MYTDFKKKILELNRQYPPYIAKKGNTFTVFGKLNIKRFENHWQVLDNNNNLINTFITSANAISWCITSKFNKSLANNIVLIDNKIDELNVKILRKKEFLKNDLEFDRREVILSQISNYMYQRIGYKKEIKKFLENAKYNNN